MTTTENTLRRRLSQRIVLFDGAMGTMIQRLKFDEQDFRGKQYVNHSRPLKGCNDLLSVTQPESIAQIHAAYLEAGADIIETNSFNSSAISLADYGLESQAYALNLAASQVARRAVDAFNLKTTGRPRFVAGAIGQKNRTDSLSTDVNRQDYRSVQFYHI